MPEAPAGRGRRYWAAQEPYLAGAATFSKGWRISHMSGSAAIAAAVVRRMLDADYHGLIITKTGHAIGALLRELTRWFSKRSSPSCP
jgi:hypothetical protein